MIKNWSYSKYNTYKQCPRKIKYRYIDKLPDEPGPAAERGTLIHKLAEDYVNGDIVGFPLELAKFAKQFKDLRKRKATTEEEWAFDKDWNRVRWDSPDMWCRGKVDLTYKTKEGIRVVIDYKTGKVRPEHADQLSFYALLAFLVHPEDEVVATSLWYLDHGTETHKTYARNLVPGLKDYWKHNTLPMMTDTEFPTNPSYLCNYCAYSKSKGGPCEF